MVQNLVKTKAAKELGYSLSFSHCHILMQFGHSMHYPGFRQMIHEANEQRKMPNLLRPQLDPPEETQCMKNTFSYLREALKYLMTCSCLSPIGKSIAKSFKFIKELLKTSFTHISKGIRKFFVGGFGCLYYYCILRTTKRNYIV